MIVVTRSPDDTRALASAVAELLRPGDVVVLAGPLGAGKTTFAQGALRALGVTDPVTSPTFTLVHEYEGRLPVAHVDVYRLERLQELHDLGFEEVVDDGRVTFVEWGDHVLQALPADRLGVHLDLERQPDHRRVHLEPHGRSWHGRADRLRDLIGRFGDGG